MEALKQLEQAQRAIAYMQSQGFISSSNSSDSDRFLINFIHFLAQPCGQIDMETKCQLIYANLPKISPVCVPEPVPCARDEDKECMAMVGLEAMQDANSTLGDFCRSYFMFHDIDINEPVSVFRFLPILSFTESYIYQLDRLNEKILNLPEEWAADLERGSQMGVKESWVDRSREQFKANPFRPLSLLLQRHQLLTERIREEFKSGEEYWSLERKLCTALATSKEISFDDVMRAIHLKSFDYRVLNLLLYQLTGAEVNELHMQFLSVSEFLVELSDDLTQYISLVKESTLYTTGLIMRMM